MASRDRSDAGEHIGQPGLWVNVVEPGCHDERIHDGGPVGAAIRAGEQPCFPSKGQAAQARSAALFVRQILPSPVKRAKPSQRLSM